MSAIQPFYLLLRIDLTDLSKKEKRLLDAELFVRICEELKEIFRGKYKEYFRLINFSYKMENVMLENNFARLIIEEILCSKEYTLSGIALYVDRFKAKGVTYDV